ncbi:hypothetical protein EUTSA_v10015408mg [Eutrema salsugineum]|uniref:Leucine-rich repeat-containing N-terminal plant-type domain-containing protein n=1 Tax=Eutrema salsugineum TaxID=72664 RepID=V4LME4_EUTSA|nr:hypothetical protein EUTSA_v10015408mg [Eutrema salsugineum]
MSTAFLSFLIFFTITITIFLATLATSASSPLHPDELNALKEKIANTLGIKRLDLKSGDPCRLRTLKTVDFVSNKDTNNTIICDHCNNLTCHITDLYLKTMSLPGKLPPQLKKLPYLKSM